MATIEAKEPSAPLSLVRRLEAAGFRAWPAKTVIYDGSWQIRITPGHPSKRLNCLVPLDPFDSRALLERVNAAEASFRQAGVTPSVRQSPLCPPGLIEVLAENGWTYTSETLVMTGAIDKLDLAHGLDHLPSHDVQRFSEACILIDQARDTTADILNAIISSIEPPAGLFLIEDQRGPKAVSICVHDTDLAGLQQVVVRSDTRRQGLGLELVSIALRWAKLRGARMAWLQVMADNLPALALYERIGFKRAYRYGYWKKAVRHA